MYERVAVHGDAGQKNIAPYPVGSSALSLTRIQHNRRMGVLLSPICWATPWLIWFTAGA